MSFLWSFIKIIWRIFRITLLVSIVIGAVVAAAYVLKLDDQVKTQFAGKLWALPARVFARPLELYEGQTLLAENLEKELQLLNYTQGTDSNSTGSFKRNGNTFVIHSRGFQFAEDTEPKRSLELKISKGQVTSLRHVDDTGPLSLMRLEPLLIGNFYPSHNEDRVLVQLDEVSPMLIKGLIAVEDKNYYDHVGVNPKSILRAMLANAKAGQTVQGGSTLTQQLVKNFYLTNERSLKRKVNEATMALLLELHYSKDKILETYLNEIYLGQNKKRAIHGFGLASQFYFSRPIRELETDQVALLIGMAKGASYYDPRRFPDRAIERRNLVLDVMAREGVISDADAELYKTRPLHITANAPPSVSPFPAYLELVKSQLQRDYQEEDLRSEGLLIFTAMDPIVQLTSEKVLSKRVEQLEKQERIPAGKLNGAIVVSSVQDGEVLAMVGGRDVRYAGYNRAIDAKRQIGSLVKPGVYLAALENPDQYTLSSLISDGPVKVRLSNGEVWEPGNYDNRDRGLVTLEEALVKSRNTPTVRIGVTLGMPKIVEKLHAMGVVADIPPYPSVLLGALELSPLEVQQMYQTIASGGSYTPLKSIRSVMDSFGRTLRRYPLNIQQVTTPEANYLLTYAMNQVTKRGTASYLSRVLPAWKNSAGKTGTTNNKRDSWYAGFTGQHVASVWVGRDDNKETGLTGGTGAIKVWGDLFKVLPTRPLKPVRPGNVRFVKVDAETGLLYNPSCGKSQTLPFLRGTQPTKYRVCVVDAPAAVEE
ncbi:penicillin-binding protein 1B [Leucothrix mucor]|uniref:penicillin-binding protein 1B n=1 Tax=Leucothrix mucor TaxID=45248 RepID=UPI0003B6C348|nr:penicillin-binding protein 1B [Leucothrix mucor]